MRTLTVQQWAWCWYDWANSAFALVCMTAFFPPLFVQAVNRELGVPAGTVAWGWFATAGLAASLAVTPLLGAFMDSRARRRQTLAVLVAFGALACGFMGWFLEGHWLSAGVAYVLGATAFVLGNVAYDSLLVGVAPPGQLDRVSAWGYSLGYIGGAVALVLSLGLWRGGHTFWAFASVGVWWAVFSLPLLLLVPEPPRGKPRPWQVLRESFRILKHNPNAFRFLLAFWLYNDGIGTVIKMAGAYGGELGIPLGHLVGALLLTQLVGVPATLAFGWAAQKFGCKKPILLALAVYVGVAFWGASVTQAWEFWVLAVAVGMVQGGAQALSRSLFARFVPAGAEAAFFSFFDLSARLAGVAGPATFSLTTQLAGSPRAGVLATTVFFLGGAWLLTGVREPGDHTGPVSETSPAG